MKNVYINDIDNIAPGYLYEEYAAEIQYPRGEFSSRTGKCPVKLRFQPYGTAVSSRETTKYGSTGGGLERTLDHEDATTTPGLKVFYASKVMSGLVIRHKRTLECACMLTPQHFASIPTVATRDEYRRNTHHTGGEADGETRAGRPVGAILYRLS